MLAISNIGTAIGLIAMGVYVMLKSWSFEVDAMNWISLASFSFVILAVSLGILSVPIIVISEIMPEKIKDAGVSISMTLLWAFSFTAIKCLPFLIEILGFHGSMYLFAGICVSSAVFTILVMPETNSKSHDEIMKSLQ